MPFYLLSSFHQSVMEIFRPLLNWFDSVSMLRSLQPYRDWLPYVTVAVILPLLLWIFLCILRSIQRNRRGRKNARPSSAPAGTAVRGKAIDIATDFVVHDPWTEPLPGAQAAPAPQPDVPSRLQEQGGSAPAPDRTNSGVVPDSAASGPIVLPAPAPRAASGPAATPVPPPEAAPAPSAPRHEVPEPPRTAAASPNTPPESEFQRIYIEMYIDLELTTNFSALRTDVNGKLSRGEPTGPLLPEGSANPEEYILASIALAALEDLQTKESRLESGELSPHGQELCKIYEYILNRLKGNGNLSEDSARKLLQDTLEKVLGTSGH